MVRPTALRFFDRLYSRRRMMIREKNPTGLDNGAQPEEVDGPAPASDKIQSLEPNVKILRLAEVLNRVGICRASIYQRMSRGSFPQSVPLGPRTVGWLEHEVTAWLAARIALRSNRVQNGPSF
jgi:prophage regulatory protein